MSRAIIPSRDIDAEEKARADAQGEEAVPVRRFALGRKHGDQDRDNRF